MCRRIVLLAGGLALVGASWLWAQENVLSQMYGLGVHAYFSGNYEEAYEHFSQAIEGGSTDPRCYYFRGLCYRRLGREEEAEMDFQKAAAFEARDSAKFYAVSVALQRVQGSERMVIEKHRAEARLAALKRQLQMQRARYEQLQEAESRVLSQQFPVPGGAPAPGAEQAAPAEAPGRATDAFPGTEPAEGAPSPFGEMPGAPGQAAPSEPAEAEPAEAEPAEAEAAEPAQPETPAEPAEAAPARPEQPVGPFGQPVPSPFETQPPTAPAEQPAAQPAEQPAPGASAESSGQEEGVSASNVFGGLMGALGRAAAGGESAETPAKPIPPQEAQQAPSPSGLTAQPPAGPPAGQDNPFGLPAEPPAAPQGPGQQAPAAQPPQAPVTPPGGQPASEGLPTQPPAAQPSGQDNPFGLPAQAPAGQPGGQ